MNGGYIELVTMVYKPTYNWRGTTLYFTWSWLETRNHDGSLHTHCKKKVPIEVARPCSQEHKKEIEPRSFNKERLIVIERTHLL